MYILYGNKSNKEPNILFKNNPIKIISNDTIAVIIISSKNNLILFLKLKELIKDNNLFIYSKTLFIHSLNIFYSFYFL